MRVGLIAGGGADSRIPGILAVDGLASSNKGSLSSTQLNRGSAINYRRRDEKGREEGTKEGQVSDRRGRQIETR